MSGETRFSSSPGPVMERYLKLKESLGRKYVTERAILLSLDRFLSAEAGGPADINGDAFSRWCKAHEHLTSGVRRAWMRAVYNFCLYRRRTEPSCFLPDPALFPPLHAYIRPHIFSEGEVRRLLEAVSKLERHPNNLLHQEVYRLAVVLLYTTGMRRGELVRLTLGDYSVYEQTLAVHESKFHKSRLLPLSADGIRELDAYLAVRRSHHLPMDSASPLLTHGMRGPYSGPGIGMGLRSLYRSAMIRTDTGALPRVHDLRHTFAVHALLRWYREDADLTAKLPYLSAYMGHVSVASTEYYLPFVESLAGAAGERFEKYCGTILCPSTGKGGSS